MTAAPSRPALTLAEIDELEQMARAATPDNHPEHPDWPNMRERGDYCSFDPGKANFEFIEACDPQTVLALLAVAREHARIKTEREAMRDLLMWAGQPGRQVFTQGTDSWYADDGHLYSAETAEELAQQLGIGKPESEAE